MQCAQAAEQCADSVNSTSADSKENIHLPSSDCMSLTFRRSLQSSQHHPTSSATNHNPVNFPPLSGLGMHSRPSSTTPVVAPRPPDGSPSTAEPSTRARQHFAEVTPPRLSHSGLVWPAKTSHKRSVSDSSSSLNERFTQHSNSPDEPCEHMRGVSRSSQKHRQLRPAQPDARNPRKSDNGALLNVAELRGLVENPFNRSATMESRTRMKCVSDGI